MTTHPPTLKQTIRTKPLIGKSHLSEPTTMHQMKLMVIHRQGAEALIAAPLIVTAFSAALFGGLLSPAITYGFERMSEYEIKWPEFTRKTSSKSGAREDRDCRFYLTTRLVQSCDADIIINDLQLFWQTFFSPGPSPSPPQSTQEPICATLCILHRSHRN